MIEQAKLKSPQNLLKVSSKSAKEELKVPHLESVPHIYLDLESPIVKKNRSSLPKTTLRPDLNIKQVNRLSAPLEHDFYKDTTPGVRKK